MEFYTWRAIDFFHGNPQHVLSLVAIDPSDPKKFYWSGGPSYCTGEDGVSYKTIKEYTFSDFVLDANHPEDRYAMACDRLECDFYKEFQHPQPTKPFESAAWIDPEGYFYPCEPAEHDSLALRLSACYYNTVHTARYKLEEKHWIRLESTGMITFSLDFITRVSLDQIETLKTLVRVCDNNKYRRSVERELKNALYMQHEDIL